MKDRTEGQEAEEAYEAEKRKRFAEAPAAQRETEDELKEKGFTLLRSEPLEDGGHCTYWRRSASDTVWRRSSGDTVIQVHPDGSTTTFEEGDWWAAERQSE